MDQTILCTLSGGYSGSKYNKIKTLRELGFQFYEATKIKTLMVKGASLNAECNLYQKTIFGDHIMFVGEVVDAINNP
jgi:flavin reductase (DIM6/NTAB) family NADH-FMN oxidoreductase RutF